MDYYSRENRGGAVGSKGYNFQDVCAIKYLFKYVDDEQFENITVEQINDFTIRLKTKEIRPFRKIDDSFKKIVVTKDIVPTHYDENGILTVNIYEFLLNPGSIEG